MKKKTKKKLSMFKISFFLLAIYFMVSLYQHQAVMSEKREELASIQQKCKDKRLANLEYERLLSAGDSRVYFERIAREKLDFAFPDEKVYIDISGS